MIEIVRHTQRNVKHWQDGDMASAGPPLGCCKPSSSSDGSSATSDLAKLVIAIERRHLSADHADTTERSTDTASAAAVATI